MKKNDSLVKVYLINRSNNFKKLLGKRSAGKPAADFDEVDARNCGAQIQGASI
jgi:hypothetical protein